MARPRDKPADVALGAQTADALRALVPTLSAEQLAAMAARLPAAAHPFLAVAPASPTA